MDGLLREVGRGLVFDDIVEEGGVWGVPHVSATQNLMSLASRSGKIVEQVRVKKKNM